MRYIIYADGGSRGNPGPAAIGAVIYNEGGEKIFEISEYIGEATNNIAEYMAIIKALNLCRDKGDFDSLQIFMDSELVIKQLQGFYKVKVEHLKELHAQVVKLLLDMQIPYEFGHVLRDKNKVADALVNKALDNL